MRSLRSLVIIAIVASSVPALAGGSLRQSLKAARQLQASPAATTTVMLGQSRASRVEGADAISVLSAHRDGKGSTQRVFEPNPQGKLIQKVSGVVYNNGGQRVQRGVDGPIGQGKIVFLNAGRFSTFDPITRKAERGELTPGNLQKVDDQR